MTIETTQMLIAAYGNYLREEEKSRHTIEKYRRDIISFLRFLDDEELSKERVVDYKAHLSSQYAPASVNSMLASLNGFFRFINRRDCVVKAVRVQRQVFCSESRELTREEYFRLLNAARGQATALVLQTLCSTGIRISELEYITVEAVASGMAVVNCKNKMRYILIPNDVRIALLAYADERGIKSGSVFVTRNGKPLDRSNVWRSLKALCAKADVAESKVYPHNLRHLFARSFYEIDKDLVRLADVLGHSSIETTRIYTMESGSRHRLAVERVQQLLSETT